MPRYALLLVLLSLPLSAEKWALQYHYDVVGKEFGIVDLAFPTGTSGIAVGTVLADNERRAQPLAILSSDGGAHWTEVALKDTPRSLFFLNQTVGWMVGVNAIWSTPDSGKTWNRVSKQLKGTRNAALLLRVHFLDAQRGWAIGFQKSVFKTEDGGKSWTPVDAAAQPGSDPVRSVYSHIAFADANHGKIVGHVLAVSDEEELPPWMAPDRALQKRLQALPSFELDTRDGGRTWSASTAAVAGSIAALSLAGTQGLAVFSYGDSFEWPSEVYRLNFTARENSSVFRQKDRNVTDARVFTNNQAFLATVEPAGRLRSAPIPGKVKMLTSTDFTNWMETPVDYRAVAQEVVLAGPDAQHVWAATDTGMILRLE